MFWLAMISFASQLGVAKPALEDQRLLFERAQRDQSIFEKDQFIHNGFSPLTADEAKRKKLRRLLVEDPYSIMIVPGVEIERLGRGRVELRIVGSSTKVKAIRISEGGWFALEAKDRAVFRQPSFKPWREADPSEPPPPPPPICHGWIVRFEGTIDLKVVTQSWAQCGGGAENAEKYDYAVQVIRLAIKANSSCSFDETNPFWSFAQCFRPSPVPTS